MRLGTSQAISWQERAKRDHSYYYHNNCKADQKDSYFGKQHTSVLHLNVPNGCRCCCCCRRYRLTLDSCTQRIRPSTRKSRSKDYFSLEKLGHQNDHRRRESERQDYPISSLRNIILILHSKKHQRLFSHVTILLLLFLCLQSTTQVRPTESSLIDRHYFPTTNKTGQCKCHSFAASFSSHELCQN